MADSAPGRALVVAREFREHPRQVVPHLDEVVFLEGLGEPTEAPHDCPELEPAALNDQPESTGRGIDFFLGSLNAKYDSLATKWEF